MKPKQQERKKRKNEKDSLWEFPKVFQVIAENVINFRYLNV